MRIDNLPHLKKLVENTFGRKILSFKDCVDLNDDVFKGTGSLISVNTLRRFFGLVKSNYLPSYTTLNVLSNYCGFNSFSEMLTAGDQEEMKPDSLLLSYIISLFKETIVTNANDPTYLDLVRLTIQFLNKYPHLVDSFQLEIAKTENGQNFYYEQFINLDKLNGYYGDGLRHYLEQKKTDEAQLFGHGLLALRYWLTGKQTLFDEHYKLMMAFEVNTTIHPFVTGRFWGIKILKAYQEQQELTFLFAEARVFFETIKQKDNKHSFPYFEYSILLPLILTSQWQEALYYTERGIEKERSTSESFIHRQLFQYLFLFKAIALTAMKQTDSALEIYTKIDTDEFFFVSKQFYTILYMILGKHLKQIKDEKQKIEQLIKEIGFTKLFDLAKYRTKILQTEENGQ